MQPIGDYQPFGGAFLSLRKKNKFEMKVLEEKLDSTQQKQYWLNNEKLGVEGGREGGNEGGD